MSKLLIIPLAALGLIAGFLNSSIAGHHYHGYSYRGDYTDMDSNQDGLITFDEFSAPHMEKYKRAFEMLDTDNDEVINEAEMDEFLKMHNFDKKLEG